MTMVVEDPTKTEMEHRKQDVSCVIGANLLRYVKGVMQDKQIRSAAVLGNLRSLSVSR